MMLRHSATVRLLIFISAAAGLAALTLGCVLFVPARAIEIIGLDDKAAHFGLFATLSFMGFALARRYGVNPLAMALQVSALALFTEVVQQTIPGRDFEFADIAMNFLGVIVAYGLFTRISITFPALDRWRVR